MRPSLYGWFLAASYAAVVLVLSLLPDTGGPGRLWDKANHFIAYAVMSFLFIRAGRAERHSLWTMITVAAGVSLFGAGVELLQSLTPTRKAEWLDALANALGAAFGAAVYHLFHRIMKNRAEVGRC